MYRCISVILITLLGFIIPSDAFDMHEWAQAPADTSGMKSVDVAHETSKADELSVAEEGVKAMDGSTEADELEKALKELHDQTYFGVVHDERPEDHKTGVKSEEHKNLHENDEASKKSEQPKIETPNGSNEGTKVIPQMEHEIKEHSIALPEHHAEASVPVSVNDVTSLIPKTPPDEHNTTSGNEDTFVNDTTPIARNMRLNTMAKIDETIEKLDSRLQTFLEAVSESSHDLSYYQSLLENAYETFCREINGDLTPLGARYPRNEGDVTPVTVMISADMSSAIRRSFDTKVEVLELAASEVATQKSKETGARTIHDALTNGLIMVRSTIASPGLTIHSTSNEMKNMNAIIADMSKSLLADIIKWTLQEDVLKKQLLAKIVERDEFIKAHKSDINVDKFTQEIRKIAGDFHIAQNEKAGAIQKQNGFKEYLDEMREDINTIQRLIDTYFATVHNGHAKAIIAEANNELNKDGQAESELRLRLAQEKVHNDAILKSEDTGEHFQCPPNYRPLDPSKPAGDGNPCGRFIRRQADQSTHV
uniref:BOV57 n=1 Tax=Babesia sp. TaxID=35084 RepID=A0A6M8PX77_9APIC|nr:BOV57 [Babesia sp.]